jgi:hypothetical protein
MAMSYLPEKSQAVQWHNHCRTNCGIKKEQPEPVMGKLKMKKLKF